MKNLGKISFWAGMIIVIGTHIYMLVAGLPESQMMGHAIINLVAAALICYGSCKKM